VALSPGVNRQGREADQPTPAGAEVIKIWIYASLNQLSTGTTLPLPLTVTLRNILILG
jgi:hypothetical protein